MLPCLGWVACRKLLTSPTPIKTPAQSSGAKDGKTREPKGRDAGFAGGKEEARR